MDDFYVTLPSSVKSTQFENTSSRYVTRLPEVLYLERDKYTVAVTDIIYPYSFLNVGRPLDYWIHFKPHLERPPVHVTFPSDQYSNLKHVVSTLNDEKRVRTKRSAVEAELVNEISRAKRSIVDEYNRAVAANNQDEDIVAQYNRAVAAAQAQSDATLSAHERAVKEEKKSLDVVEEFNTAVANSKKDEIEGDKIAREYELAAAAAREKAENDRKKSEAAAKKAEDDKKKAEASAKKIEDDKKAEDDRKKAEAAAKKIEDDKKADDDRKKAEAVAKKADDDRKKAEAVAKKADEDKKKAEAAAKKAQDDRKKAEAAAKKAEDDRKKAEAAAKKTESDKKAEDDRKKAEAAAKKAEEDKKKAQAAAKKAEEDKKKAQAAAKKAEDDKKKAQAAVKKAEDAKKAEEARKIEEAVKKAEEARKLEESVKKAEEARKIEEAVKKAEETRKIEEAVKEKVEQDVEMEAEAKQLVEEFEKFTGHSGQSTIQEQYESAKKAKDASNKTIQQQYDEAVEKTKHQGPVVNVAQTNPIVNEWNRAHEMSISNILFWSEYKDIVLKILKKPSDKPSYDELKRLLVKNRTKIYIEKAANAHGHLKFKEHDDRIQIDFLKPEEVAFVEFEPSCGYFLGFHDNIVHQSGAAPSKVDYFGNVSTLYLYCDIVDPIIVGDQKNSLLAVIPCSGKYGEMIHHTIPQPRYLPIMNNTVDSIKVELLSEFAEPIKFNWGSTIIVLHFKRI